MKNLFTRLLFFVGLITYLAFLGNSSGSPAGRTGAPGESTCASSSCHNTTANSGSATISLQLNGGEEMYTLGETHKITIAADGLQSVSKNGFEVVALDAQDNNVGEWILSGNDKRTRSASSRDYVTHTSSGNAQAAWEIDWKAPTETAGAITFYVAYNDANGNGGRSGDNIYTTSLQVSEAVVSSVNNIIGLETVKVFPNPVHEMLTVQISLSGDAKLSGRLINITGQQVADLFEEQFSAGAHQKTISLANDLAAGHYFLELRNAEGGIKSIPVVKK